MPTNQQGAKSSAAPAPYLRVRDIVRPHGLMPFSRSTWYSLVAKGLVPPGIRLSSGIVAWKREDVLALADSAPAQSASLTAP